MSPRKEEACTRRAGADDGFSASRCGLSGTANCASAKIGVFNCVTPKVVKRLKTQADEGLTTADEAGYVFLRQPQDSIEKSSARPLNSRSEQVVGASPRLSPGNAHH
jgi:hypothetical protein